MCGIVGYTGDRCAAPILLDGLEKLEYRGYDSAGLAVSGDNGEHVVVKCMGKLDRLKDITENGKALPGKCGIGHTRWATHGEPSEVNAHPHFNDDKTIVAVHNGIIENYDRLKDKLLSKGYKFYSQTDTEIAAKLVDYYYKKWGTPLEALVSFSLRAKGSYALAVMFSDYPGEIYVARKDSPLIVGICDGEAYIASDVPAILKYTRNVYYMGDMEVARIKKGGAEFFDVDKRSVKREPVRIEWDVSAAEKGGYPHFMQKEIEEQPEVIGRIINAYIRGGEISFASAGLSAEFIKRIKRIHIAACGSAYHAGMVAKYVTEGLAGIAAEPAVASEFRYMNPVFLEGDVILLISQSGETADTLAALRKAKSDKIPTIAIVNVVGSSIAREADYTLYTHAGPEISVATTKAYSAQIAVCYLIAVLLAKLNGKIGEERYRSLTASLVSLPDLMRKVINADEELKRFSAGLVARKEAFFVGRGIDYAVCMEGSLKLKEISYIHSEAYAAGELKHGTISLIEKDTPVIGVLSQPHLYEKSVSNLREVKSRGAYVAVITSQRNKETEELADFVFHIPETEPYFAASLAVIPLQIIAYRVSVGKGLDADKPRNLAKCVTVE